MASTSFLVLDPNGATWWTFDANGSTDDEGPWLEPGRVLAPDSALVFLDGGQPEGPVITNVGNDDTTVTCHIAAGGIEGEWEIVCRVTDDRAPLPNIDDHVLHLTVDGTAHTPS
ncbi:MAG: hypothetical protein AAGA99_22395 [Actinomycetota bacterium]